MKNNLKALRDKSKLTPKQLAILLNISVHTYIAIEKEKFSLSGEIIIMLSRIYQIPTHIILGDMKDYIYEIDLQTRELANLDEDERFKIAFKNLTGQEPGKAIYRQIRKAKMQIIENLNG